MEHEPTKIESSLDTTDIDDAKSAADTSDTTERVQPIPDIELNALHKSKDIFMENISIPSKLNSLPRRNTYSPQLKEERHTRLGVTTLIGILLILSIVAVKFTPNSVDINGYHVISITLLCIFIIWASHFLMVIFSFKHLHYIRVQRKRFFYDMDANYNKIHLFIPYSYQEKKNIPMSSISLLCALRGSNIERMGTSFFDCTFALIFSAVFMKWTEIKHKNDGFIEIESIMLLLSAYGAFLVPSWSLERYSNLSNIMHYIATSTCVILAPLAFCLYQEWSILSTIILCISYTSLFMWIGIMEYVQSIKYDDDDIAKVHRNSLIVLLIELFGLFCIYSTYILFIFCMANDLTLSPY